MSLKHFDTVTDLVEYISENAGCADVYSFSPDELAQLIEQVRDLGAAQVSTESFIRKMTDFVNFLDNTIDCDDLFMADEEDNDDGDGGFLGAEGDEDDFEDERSGPAGFVGGAPCACGSRATPMQGGFAGAGTPHQGENRQGGFAQSAGGFSQGPTPQARPQGPCCSRPSPARHTNPREALSRMLGVQDVVKSNSMRIAGAINRQPEDQREGLLNLVREVIPNRAAQIAHLVSEL